MPVRRESDGSREYGPTWESLAERKIREAIERGDFDRLSGLGQPLDLRENPFGRDWELAHKLLKDNGFLPAWIELQRELEQDREALAALPARLRARGYRRADAWEAYRQAVAALDQKIARFNLIVPFVWLQQARVGEQRARERFEAAWAEPGR
jgi:hypothetical protein